MPRSQTVYVYVHTTFYAKNARCLLVPTLHCLPTTNKSLKITTLNPHGASYISKSCAQFLKPNKRWNEEIVTESPPFKERFHLGILKSEKMLPVIYQFHSLWLCIMIFVAQTDIPTWKRLIKRISCAADKTWDQRSVVLSGMDPDHNSGDFPRTSADLSANMDATFITARRFDCLDS